MNMSRFKSGDRVRRKTDNTPNHVAVGTVITAIPNQYAPAIFSEYEVDFGSSGILIAYDHQLEFV
jgi:hypothetical protein